MPQFYYKAKKTTGELIEGFLDANGKSGAITLLSREGLFPLSVQETGKQNRSVSKNIKVSLNALIYFTDETADLLDSAIPLPQALELISVHSPHRELKALSSQLQSKIKEGKPFSEALGAYPSIFSPFYINIIKSGEVSGALEKVMKDLARHFQLYQSIKSRLVEALLYPLFLAGMGILSLLIMVYFVIPRLIPIFEDMDVSLPVPTRMVLFITSFLTDWGPLILVFFLLAFFALFRLFHIKKVCLVFQKTLVRIPLAGELLSARYLSEIFQSLETMMINGVQVLEALKIAVASCPFLLYKEAFKNILSGVAGGGSLHRSFEIEKIFPSKIIAVLKVGEESGKIEAALSKLSRYYQNYFETRIGVMTKLIGPIFIVCIAGFILFILIAVLLPIVQVNIAI